MLFELRPFRAGQFYTILLWDLFIFDKIENFDAGAIPPRDAMGIVSSHHGARGFATSLVYCALSGLGEHFVYGSNGMI